MKNKHLLKVFSMGALSSLLVTPLVLNGVSDSVQEEAIAQSVEDNHRSIKRSAVSDDIYSLENASTWANATYAKDNDDGKYWLHGFASNHSMEADLSKDLIRIAFKVKNGVDYTLKLGWGFNNIEENSGITVCGVPNITGSSNTWGQAKLASKNNGGFQTEFFGDEMGDEETYHFTGNSSGAYFLVINADLYEGFTFHLKTELIQDDVIDTQEPVVTASKYAISLPVKTSTRLTKEYLLNQKIFKFNEYAYCNADLFKYFITLTFAQNENNENNILNVVNDRCSKEIKIDYIENVCDYECCIGALNKFLKRLKIALKRYNEKNGTLYELIYLGVPEYQKNGAIHYHFLFGDLPDEFLYNVANWLDYDYFNKKKKNGLGIKYWTYGKSDVDEIRDKARVTSYVFKYMMKSLYELDETEYLDRLNKKRYFNSFNLEEAEIKYASSFKESDLDIYSSYQKEVLNTFNDSMIKKVIYQVKPLNENDVLNNKEELIN